MQTQEYKDYMRSDEWEAKKQERIAIDGGCVMCGRPIEALKKSMCIVWPMQDQVMRMYLQAFVLCAVRVIRRYTHIITAKESE